jgi:polysaccharide pyruvyl transferase WcaK-like protein
LDGIITSLDRLGYTEYCKSSRDQDVEEERLYYKEIQCLKKLKSLRPSWKPSYEQKDAVFHACNRMVGDRYHAAICSVYEQLKKLM